RPRPRLPRAARRLRDDERRRSSRGRADRDRRAPGRPRDERALEPRALEVDRDRLGAGAARRGGRADPDQGQRVARGGARASAAVLRPRRGAAPRMTSFAFLSPREARAGGGFEPRLASPLSRAVEHAPWLRDLSLVPKLELRGDVAAL